MTQNQPRMLGKLRKHGEFLRCQMHLFSVAQHRAVKEVDRHSSGGERLLVLLASKVGEIRKVSIELGGLGSDRGDHILVAGSASP